jgi:phage terminase small subunit
VLHPLGRMMGVMDSEIRQLEDRFGLNPLARARLGITIGEAARTLADMNRMLEEDDA